MGLMGQTGGRRAGREFLLGEKNLPMIVPLRTGIIFTIREGAIWLQTERAYP